MSRDVRSEFYAIKKHLVLGECVLSAARVGRPARGGDEHGQRCAASHLGAVQDDVLDLIVHCPPYVAWQALLDVGNVKVRHRDICPFCEVSRAIEEDDHDDDPRGTNGIELTLKNLPIHPILP